MKKILTVLILVFSLVPVFADKANVCVYPENAEISSYINNYFSDNATVVGSTLTVGNDLLESGDLNLMHLICDTSKAELLVMPLKDTLSGFTHLRLYVFNPGTEEFKNIWETLTKTSFDYGIEVAFKLAEFIPGDKDLSKLENAMNDDFRIIEIPTLSSRELKPKWMDDKNLYVDARNKFYSSFGRTIFIFGTKVLFRSLNTDSDKMLNAAEGVCTAGICLSITDMIRNMFDYFRYADYVSP